MGIIEPMYLLGEAKKADINKTSSYFSSAAMMMGGSIRIGIGMTTLVRAVSKSACHKQKKT